VFFIRGKHVILDEDVARLFGTETKRLNEQIKRNAARFDDEYLFRLTAEELSSLRSQFATSNSERGGRRYLPFAFTDLGVVMAATVLKTERAIIATRTVVRTFVAMERNKNDVEKGQNLPVAFETKSMVPLAVEMRQGLMGKVNDALTKVLDAMVNPVAQTSVRDEAKQLIAQGLDAIKDHLKATGIQNEKSIAEIRKILAEAETVDATTQRTAVDTRHLELALLLAAQRYVETGAVEALDAVLRDLSA
jgi:phage regulator Rha-like protein